MGRGGGGILTTRYPAPDSDAELTAVHFTLSEDGTPVSRDIPVGFYTVTFSFYNDATQDEAHKLFSCSQTVNIYKNLETNWWKNSTAGATYISNQSGTFTLSPDVIRRYARHNFYVDPQRGSDTNAGSWYDPFDSVKTAVKKICNTNDGEPYTVSLLSDDTDASGDSYTSEDKAYIDINPAAALTLTILGRDDNDKNVLRTINAARTADKTGRVMYIGSKATVTLSNIGITGGYASDNGGGIFVGGAGTLTITDGTIDGNKAKSGGGVYVDGGTFTMTGGTISGNTATTSNGGGIYNAGTLKLSNVAISGSGNIDTPEALNGGGIAHADGSLTITGGTISECTAVYRGGGIRIAHGNVKITGLTISSCKTSVEKISNPDTITGGGGIYNISGTASAPVVLENCTITGCTVNGKDNYRYGGGGIYNDAGVLAITGGEITGGGNIENKDAYYGGGIYNNKGTLVIENGAKISDCTSSSGGGIYSRDGATLTVSSITISGCKAISSGGGIDNNGSSSAVAVATVTDCTIESCTAGNWEGGGIFTNGYSTLTVTGGSIVNSSATKGGGISASGTFTVSGVTIKNCTANSWGGGIYTSDYDESSEIENCTITGCSVTGMNSDGSSIYSNGGGGIANNSGGKTLTVTGGQITGCRAPKYGGGIYIVTGNLTVSGLTITGGGTVDEPDALYGGGICVDGGSGGGRVLTMTDSEIKNCTASYGAAVWNGGTCNLTGCKITNCTAKTSGGGVIGASNSIATITNCTITGCTANGNGSGGGGIYINTSTVTVIGGTVSGCTGRYGGGIMCINSGSCTLDGCVVQDNTSIDGYGAVYLGGSNTADAVLNVKGAAKITGTGAAQKIYISSAYSAVVITGELTEPVVAKIHSSVYKSAPTVLKDNTDDGSLVKAHYARFQSDHAGYSIYDDGVLRLPPTEGGVVTEEHTCTFSLDKTEITASGDQTLTVTATVTTTGQDGTTQKTFSGADLDWAAIKVFCGMQEITQADFSGLSVNGGSVTIPSDMWDEAYYVQAAGTYTCENGCKKAFSGQIPFEVRRNAVPAGFVKINGGTVSGSGHPDIPDSAGSEHKGVFIAGRTVTLSPFMMCDHEVTQGEWEEVMAGNADGVTTDPSSCKAGSTNYAVNFGTEQKNRPVESMTWYDAVYYCNERSKKEGLTPVYDISGITVSSYGKITAATVTLIQGGGTRPNGYRLPTEAEWEFAARGGNPNSSAWNCLFSGAATASGTAYNASVNSGLDSVGWYEYNNKTGTTTADSQTDTADGKGTHEVKQKAANSLGLYDMSGNVWEWCWDLTGTVSTGSETDPTGASSESTNRINRGGAYYNQAFYQNVCRRNAAPPGSGYINIGFRVVRSVSQ